MNADEDPDLSALIRREGTRHRASETLRAAIRTQVALADAGRPAAARRAPWHGVSWRSAVAGFACGVVVALVAGIAFQRWAELPGLEAELVAAHVHALTHGPLVEVVSSDRHTVKPWFQGRLDYAPPVHDLAAAGFPLAGARVERLQRQDVAVLAYRHNGHVVDVFVWPADGAEAPRRTLRRGFSLLHAADASMQIWVVSDADAAELQRFWAAWQAAATPAR